MKKYVHVDDGIIVQKELKEEMNNLVKGIVERKPMKKRPNVLKL